MSGSNPSNPKQRYGDLKPNLALCPGTAACYWAVAQEVGADKYGPFNWRIDPVEAMTYIAAAKRHLDLWTDRQEYSRDTEDLAKRMHNLGAVMASCAILIDAMECGTLIDNRPISAGAVDRVQERERSYRLGYVQNDYMTVLCEQAQEFIKEVR